MAEPVFTLSVVLAVLIGGVLLLWVRHLSLGWRGASKSGARLPDGSLGWPIIGETLALARNPEAYAFSQCTRYGKIFKSSLFLRPTIVGMTPEFAKFVLSNSTDFASGYPTNVLEMYGRKAFLFQDGPSHVTIKRVLQKSILPEGLRTKVNVLESILLENMASWDERATIVTKDEIAKIAMDIGMWIILGVRNIDSTPEGRKGLESLQQLRTSLMSLPVNIPGSAYNKGLKARIGLKEYFRYLVEKRKGHEHTEAGMLGEFLACQEDPQAQQEVRDLDEDVMVDNLFVMWFASYDNTITSFTWILKTLLDNPDVFSFIKAEQQKILESKDPFVKGPRLSWEDTRKMEYTQKFFQELHRTLSIAPMVLRKATRDVEYEGYLIPKGWGVWPAFKFIHLDPTNYPDPKSFNPDRFDGKQKPYTFLPFSAGSHLCPGVELEKLITFIFIHHLTTTYTFESTAPYTGMTYMPHPTPRGGYPVTISRRI